MRDFPPGIANKGGTTRLMPIKSRGTIVDTRSQGPWRFVRRDITRKRSVYGVVEASESVVVTAIDARSKVY